MTVGNLVALRQTRMVRLLAWSSVAQAGYIIAPLAVGGRGVPAAAAYAVFFVLLEFVAFGAIVALRPPGADGGEIAAYRGAGPSLALAGRGPGAGVRGPGRTPARPGRPVRQGDDRRRADRHGLGRAGRGGRAERGDRAGLLRPGDRDPLREPGRRRGRRSAPAEAAGVLPVATALVAASALAVALGFAPRLLFDSLSR